MFRVTAALVASLAASGCALMPGVPAGPIPGVGARLGGTFAHAYGAADVAIREPSGERTEVRGNAALSPAYGLDGPVLTPLRLGARVTPTRWLELGADAGILDLGLQLRAGPLDAARAVPWGVELEWRTGHGRFDSGFVERRRSYRARVEVYPALPLGGAAADAFGVIAAGASTGRELLQPLLPPRFDEYGEHFNGIPLEVLRDEARLELAVGAHWLWPVAFLSAVVMPWFTLNDGGVRALGCQDCTPIELESVQSAWGFGIALSGGLVLGP